DARRKERLGLGSGHIAAQQAPARTQPADQFELDPLLVARPDIVDRFARLLLVEAEAGENRMAKRQRGFEGLANLKVDAGLDQPQRMAAVERTHVELGERELRAAQLDDTVGR